MDAPWSTARIQEWRKIDSGTKKHRCKCDRCYYGWLIRFTVPPFPYETESQPKSLSNATTERQSRPHTLYTIPIVQSQNERKKKSLVVPESSSRRTVMLLDRQTSEKIGTAKKSHLCQKTTCRQSAHDQETELS